MARKLITYLVGILIAVQTLTPPLIFSINFTNSPVKFLWVFMICAFCAFWFFFSKTNILFRLGLIYLLVSVFLSKIPQLSMATFIWVMIFAGFYLLCREIDDWTPIFKILVSIFCLQWLFVVMRSLKLDPILNFTSGWYICSGSIGNVMQFKCLMIILVALFIKRMRVKRTWMYLAYTALVGVGLLYFAWHQPWEYFGYARGAAWLETFRLYLRHPVVGYGIGTFQALFPALGQGKFVYEGAWLQAHNEFIQMLFECGLVGFTIMAACAIQFLRRTRGMNRISAILILYSMLFQFPLHQHTAQLPLLLLIALSEPKDKGWIYG